MSHALASCYPPRVACIHTCYTRARHLLACYYLACERPSPHARDLLTIALDIARADGLVAAQSVLPVYLRDKVTS